MSAALVLSARSEVLIPHPMDLSLLLVSVQQLVQVAHIIGSVSNKVIKRILKIKSSFLPSYFFSFSLSPYYLPFSSLWFHIMILIFHFISLFCLPFFRVLSNKVRIPYLLIIFHVMVLTCRFIYLFIYLFPLPFLFLLIPICSLTTCLVDP
jgi:hypothetical protein